MPRTAVTAILVTLAVAASAACGASSKQVRTAKTARYKTNFSTVWNVVVEEVRKEVKTLKREDPIRGELETEWRLVEKRGYDTTEEGTVQSGLFLRYMARAIGPEPWKIVVEVEAAEYKPGMAMLQPIRRGAPDEPAYVQVRLDNLYVRIHERLRPYAVVVEDRRKADATPRTFDTSPWPTLPPSAAQVVARVHDAAKRKDLDAMRGLMAAEFTWSLGGESSADLAITMWSADPQLLRSLAATLAAGCEPDASQKLVTCPGGSAMEGGGPRAGFQESGGVWRFVWFLGQ